MQLVNLAHEREIGCRHRAWQVVHRAARDADGLGLLGDAQLVITVDHRLAFSNPALLSAPSKKSFSRLARRSWRSEPSRRLVASPIYRRCRARTPPPRRLELRPSATPILREHPFGPACPTLA